MATETETLKGVYAALNRNDIPAVLAFFDPQIERVETAGFPLPGTYRGHAEVEAHFKQGRDTWAEGGCEPEQFIASGDKVAVLVHVRVRLKNNSDWLEGRIADVFTFRKGRIIEMRSFLDRQEALAWAGVKP